jgi:uncharacterized membrane protein YkgB
MCRRDEISAKGQHMRLRIHWYCPSTIIPFFPDGWAASAGGFPAMNENVAFLMKDFVLLAVSFYLLKQDLLRLSLAQYQETSQSGGAPIEVSLGADRKLA